MPQSRATAGWGPALPPWSLSEAPPKPPLSLRAQVMVSKLLSNLVIMGLVLRMADFPKAQQVGTRT